MNSDKSSPFDVGANMYVTSLNVIRRLSALYFLREVRYDTHVGCICMCISCSSVMTPLLCLRRPPVTESLIILLRLEQLPLKSILSLSFTSYYLLAIVGTVPSRA